MISKNYEESDNNPIGNANLSRTNRLFRILGEVG